MNLKSAPFNILIYVDKESLGIKLRKERLNYFPENLWLLNNFKKDFFEVEGNLRSYSASSFKRVITSKLTEYIYSLKLSMKKLAVSIKSSLFSSVIFMS